MTDSSEEAFNRIVAEPCAYCGNPDCTTRKECAEAAEYLARHDEGARRLYLGPLLIKRGAA